MTAPERDRLVARVAAGRTRIVVDGTSYWVRGNTPVERLYAAELAADAEAEALAAGALSEPDLLALMRARGLWRDADDALLAALQKDQENIKVNLYRAAFDPRKRDLGRDLLRKNREAVSALLTRRHALDDSTAAAAGRLARARYLTGVALLRHCGTPVWAGDDFWQSADPLLDKAVAAAAAAALSEAEVRELARTDPWRTLWACRHSEGAVFGRPAADLTDDQRHLTVWSRVYDNAHEDPDCPPDAVVADDDLFDGWSVLRRRERDAAQARKRGEDAIGNEKIANSGEVFVLTTEEGREDVESLNDEQARLVKARREAALRAKGSLQEADMPDSKERILAQFAEERRARG